MALIRAFMGLFNYVLRLFLMNCIQKQAIFPPWALGQALITQTTQFTIRYDTSKVHTIHTHIGALNQGKLVAQNSASLSALSDPPY